MSAVALAKAEAAPPGCTQSGSRAADARVVCRAGSAAARSSPPRDPAYVRLAVRRASRAKGQYIRAGIAEREYVGRVPRSGPGREHMSLSPGTRIGHDAVTAQIAVGPSTRLCH